jgi:hypothetical protein
MAEAPLNEPLLVTYYTGAYPERRVITTEEGRQGWLSAARFYTISDLIRAAEIVAAITPEGCELLPELITGVGNPDHCIWLDPALHVRVKVRKLAPPVRYEYVAEEHERTAKVGDWVWLPGLDWCEVLPENVANLNGTVQLCARRVEVKP